MSRQKWIFRENSYGDKLDTCLSELASMRVEEAMKKFEFMDQANAKFVLERAKGLANLDLKGRCYIGREMRV